MTPETKPLSFLDIYDLYCESRKGSVAETTLELEFKGKFRRAIVEVIASVGNNALAIRNYLVDHRQAKTTKECLRHLSKACHLGIKHKNISDNPFIPLLPIAMRALREPKLAIVRLVVLTTIFLN